ncbi:hypothetical protein ACFLYD_03350 [Chloroflexota bacterium]
MHWTERRRAKTNLGLALRARGWTLYGFHEDRSDPMTDYHAPASWDGVAERGGYVVVVDISPESSLLKRSSGWRTTQRVRGDDCAHCGASGKEPDGWALEEARANPHAFNQSWARDVQALLPDVVNPRLFDADGDQKCIHCNGKGHAWKLEEVTLPWPSFQGNSTRKLWHVEKDGRILDSGIGLGPCADWDRERATAAVERIVNRIEAAVARYEGTTATTTVDRQDSAGGVTIRRNPERQGIEVVFPAKPDEEIRTALKRLGFRWSRRQGLWYARFRPSLWSQVHDLLGVSDAEELASGPDQRDSEPDETPKPVLDEAEAYRTASTPGSAPSHVGTDAPPWTMSRLAYQESRALCVAGVPILNAKDGRDHEAAVRQATAEGLPVPPHVLAEYGLAEEALVSGRTSPTEVETLQLALFTSS